MASAGSTKIKEAFAVILIGIILIPIVNSLAVQANVTGVALTVVTLLPVLLALVVVIYVVGLF